MFLPSQRHAGIQNTQHFLEKKTAIPARKTLLSLPHKNSAHQTARVWREHNASITRVFLVVVVFYVPQGSHIRSRNIILPQKNIPASKKLSLPKKNIPATIPAPRKLSWPQKTYYACPNKLLSLPHKNAIPVP